MQPHSGRVRTPLPLCPERRSFAVTGGDDETPPQKVGRICVGTPGRGTGSPGALDRAAPPEIASCRDPMESDRLDELHQCAVGSWLALAQWHQPVDPLDRDLPSLLVCPAFPWPSAAAARDGEWEGVRRGWRRKCKYLVLQQQLAFWRLIQRVCTFSRAAKP